MKESDLNIMRLGADILSVLLQDCWAADPDVRPSFESVLVRLAAQLIALRAN